jgi:1,4-dihydroxy-2-naphthoate polyprenyltransferase
MAARPQTLPAGASPVIVGVGLAIAFEEVAALPALAALVGALCIQIGTNFANDYYDAVRGADTEDREGFTRVTAGGLIAPAEVKRAMYVTFALAILVGVYLVAVGGVPIIVIGLASVASGIAYTGGPYPFGYYGLGDLFVFVFFGVVAVTGTYYVQAAALATTDPFPLWLPEGTVPIGALVASLGVAGLTTCILIVNNVRDVETDRATGKRTLAVLVGYSWSRVEFVAMAGMAYVIPFVFLADPRFGIAVCLPVLTLPYAISVTRTVLTHKSGEALNPALERVGKLLAGYSVLFAIGLAV